MGVLTKMKRKIKFMSYATKKEGTSAAAAMEETTNTKAATMRSGQESGNVSSSSSNTSPPKAARKSISISSHSSEIASINNDFESNMESFLENARFGNYDNVKEAVLKYNAMINDEHQQALAKSTFDINYRGKFLSLLIKYFTYVI